MNVTYQVENFESLIPELKFFVGPHWAELGLDHQDVPVDMDWGRYVKMDNEKTLHVVTTRIDGELIGYCFHVVSGLLHYKSTLHAVADLYYVKPEYRKSKVGVGMFLFVEQSLKALGVIKIITATKTHLHHGPLFLGLGYKEIETVYSKII